MKGSTLALLVLAAAANGTYAPPPVSGSADRCNGQRARMWSLVPRLDGAGLERGCCGVLGDELRNLVEKHLVQLVLVDESARRQYAGHDPRQHKLLRRHERIGAILVLQLHALRPRYATHTARILSLCRPTQW